jgi:hypothetical protein
MKNQEPILLDFVIDQLTNSIQNTISGDSSQTEVLRLTMIAVVGENINNGIFSFAKCFTKQVQ